MRSDHLKAGHGSLGKKGAGTLGLEAHQITKVLPWLSLEKVGFRDLEFAQILEREINSTSGSVFGHVTENIRHLQRVAKPFRVELAPGDFCNRRFRC